MTEEKKPPPKLSDFKDLLRKLMQVPKREADEKEAEYQMGRKSVRKKRSA
jgi:hypothetical protein